MKVRTFRSALLINGLGAGIVHSLCLEHRGGWGHLLLFLGGKDRIEDWLFKEKKKALKSCGIAWGELINGAGV